jgi:hypothetical protein
VKAWSSLNCDAPFKVIAVCARRTDGAATTAIDPPIIFKISRLSISKFLSRQLTALTAVGLQQSTRRMIVKVSPIFALQHAGEALFVTTRLVQIRLEKAGYRGLPCDKFF